MVGTHDRARLLCAVVTSAWSFAAAMDRPASAEDRSPLPPIAGARASAAGCILPRSVPTAPMACAPGEDRHVSNCVVQLADAGAVLGDARAPLGRVRDTLG